MKLPLYQVDAFATRPFQGNPAAVVPLDEWLDDFVLQSIASENNLSETAFFVTSDGIVHLRWFTPECEVDLCGHATLASAHVLFRHLGRTGPAIPFTTKSGTLIVHRDDPGYRMDFPALVPRPIATPEGTAKGLGIEPRKCLMASNLVAVYDDPEDIQQISPVPSILRALPGQGVVVTAPGNEEDFVSRYFAPKYGIDEDPVTGSTHCELTPYWAARTGRDELTARQCSKRGGTLACRIDEDRVHLTGQAVDYLEGTISLP